MGALNQIPCSSENSSEGRKPLRARGDEGTRTKPSESTKKISYEISETEAASTGGSVPGQYVRTYI